MKLDLPPDVAASISQIINSRSKPQINLPYYTKNYGAEMIAILLKWRNNNYRDFHMSATELAIKPRTLRNFFENSRKYIVENLEDYALSNEDAAFVKEALSLWTARQQGDGFWIRAGNSVAESAGSMSAFMTFAKPPSKADAKDIRSAFIMWINEGAPGEFDRIGVALTDDDLVFFRDRQAELAGQFTALITKTRVKFKAVI